MSSHRRCCCGNSIIETCSVCYYIPNPLPGECEECQSGNEATVSFSSSFPSPTVRTMKTWSNVVVTNTIDDYVMPCPNFPGEPPRCAIFDENGVQVNSRDADAAPWNPCCTAICIGTKYGEPVVEEGEFPLEIRTAGGGMQGGGFCPTCVNYTPNTFIRSLSPRSYSIEIVFKRYRRGVSGTFFCDYRAFINGIEPGGGANGNANYYHCIALSRRPNGNITVPGTNPPQTEPQVDPNGTMFWPCRNPFGDPSFANSSGGRQFPDSIYDGNIGEEDPALFGTECTRCLDFYAEDGDQTVFDVIHSNAQPDETDLWRKKFSVIKINHYHYGDYYGSAFDSEASTFYEIYQDFTGCLLKENYLAQNPPNGPIDSIFAEIQLYYFKPLENCATEFNNSRCFNKGTYKLFYVITRYNPRRLVPEAERPYVPLSSSGGFGIPKWYSGTPDNLPRNDFIYPQTITLS